jgi:hypothetical protein
MKTRIWSLVLALAGLLGQSPDASAVPQRLAYTGELMAANGLPYSGEVQVEARIYAGASGGSALYTEALGEVTVMAGALTAELASATLQTLFSANSTLWLEFTIDGEVLSPRQQLLSAPYALTAGNAAMLGGVAASNYQQKNTPVPESSLPTDAIAQVSNGNLVNEFTSQGTNPSSVPVLDAPASPAIVITNVDENPSSYTTSLLINSSFTLTSQSRITMTLWPPATTGVAPIVLINDQLLPFGTYANVWTIGNTPALADLLAKSPGGVWNLRIQDTDDTVPAQGQVGTATTFTVSYDVVRANHLQAKGRLDVDGALNVAGVLTAGGGFVRKANFKAFNGGNHTPSANSIIPDRTLTFQKVRSDSAIRVTWQDTTRCAAGGGNSCRVQIQVDGQNCTAPSAMQFDWYMDPVSTNHHRPATITAYCSATALGPIAAGNRTVSVLFTGAAGGTAGQFYVGWDLSQGSLAVEEIF